MKLMQQTESDDEIYSRLNHFQISKWFQPPGAQKP